MPQFRTGVPALDPEAVETSANPCYTSSMEANATLAKYPLTDEQQAIIAAAKTGDNAVVTAVAGSGKTSTLREIGHALSPAFGIYLAFGKDIQTEAEKSFPANVKCQTAHSVAWWYVKDNYDGLVTKKNDPKPWDIPAIIGMRQREFPFEDSAVGEPRVMTNTNMVSHANVMVARFCRSADAELTERHAPREFVNHADQGIFARTVLPFAQRIWADQISPAGRLRTTPDTFLKVWSLDCPQLPYAFILFDEAQDADPAIAHVIRNADDARSSWWATPLRPSTAGAARWTR
jgi:hypothetical protein